jgi:hypothetical protein
MSFLYSVAERKKIRLSSPLFSDSSLVPKSVERGRIDDPTGEVGAVSRKPLDP